jgi:hypothetical protein
MPEFTQLFLDEILAKYKDTAEVERKQAIEERMYFYDDNFGNYIQQELKNLFVKENYNALKLQIDDSINIVEFIVNEVSKVYFMDPKRTVADGSQERFDEIVKHAQYNLKLDKANKISNCCNESCVLIMPRNDSIELDVVAPDVLTVVQDKKDPTKAWAIIYEVNFVDTQTSPVTQASADDRYFVYWGKDGKHFRFDKNFGIIKDPDNKEGVNPYMDEKGEYILPIVFFHKEMNENSIWNSTAGNKMFSAQKQVSVLSTLFNYYCKWQSFKQIYVTGNYDLEKSKEQILDPAELFQIVGTDIEIGTLDLQANLDAFNKVVDSKIERALNQEGLALEQFKRTGDAASGYSIKVKKEPLIERRNQQIKFYRDYEAELYKKVAIVNNAAYPKKKMDPKKFSIDFTPMQIEETVEEQVKKKTWEFTNNMSTPIDYMMEKYGLTEKEARKKYEENKQFFQQQNGRVEQARADLEGALSGEA